MIQEVNTAPLQFERIVVDVMKEPLGEHGFELQQAFHLYWNELVTFERNRQGQRERIRFGRACYNEETIKSDADDEVDRGRHDEHAGQEWLSRRRLYVQLITGEATTQHLHTDGQPFEREEKSMWYYQNEADLRRMLREDTLPLLLTVGMQEFDYSLEDVLERTERAPTAA